MKHWLLDQLARLGGHLGAALEGARSAPLPAAGALVGAGAPQPHHPSNPPEGRVDDAEEFQDLLTSLGATDGPGDLDAQVHFKELEIAELQRSLKELRGMGDTLAELEQLHLAEREGLARERDLAWEEARLWYARSQEMLAHLEQAAQAHAALAAQNSARQAVPEPAAAPRAADGGALQERYEALRRRHGRLAARWRGLPREERAAATELAELRATSSEQEREAARLGARVLRLERELERRDAQRERDRERLAKAKERTAAARERGREQRERALARGAELKELRELLRQRDARLEALGAACEALSSELASCSGDGEGPRGTKGALAGLRRRLEDALAVLR